MRDMTIPEGAALVALTILLALMASRRGVKKGDLALWLGSGCLFEIYPTIIFGIVITAVHYGFFNSPNVLALAPGDLAFQQYLFGMELFLNGIFSLLAMVIAGYMLGRYVGVGFISSVALGYYSYWLACF